MNKAAREPIRVDVRVMEAIAGLVIELGERTLPGGGRVKTGITLDREWITLTRAGHAPVIVSVSEILAAMAGVQARHPLARPTRSRGGAG